MVAMRSLGSVDGKVKQWLKALASVGERSEMQVLRLRRAVKLRGFAQDDTLWRNDEQ